MKNPELLDLYSDYLLSSFNLATATNMSAVLNEAVSHDKISRFLGQRLFTQIDYWRCIKPIVRSIEHEDGVIKIDDTYEEKTYSTENEIICWHWDHSKSRNIKGMNILNFLYQSPLKETNRCSIPVAFEVIKKTEKYFDKKSGKVKRRSEVSKNELLRDRLRILHQLNRVKFKYVLWDTWFSSKENFEFVHCTLNKYFIAAVKSDRPVAMSMEEKLAGKFKRVDEQSIETNQTVTVYLRGLDFPVLLVKQIFTNKDGSHGVLYAVTNNLQLTYQAILTTYHERWGVEDFHKSLKQNVGLEKSPTKNEITQSNHIFAAMIAWTKLELLTIKTQTNHFSLKARLYLKAVQAAFDELQQVKQHFKKLEAPSNNFMQNSTLLLE